MRIGVVCEGPTDFVVMRSFFAKDLRKDFGPIDFQIIQPALDNTLPGGWSQVLYWLENNPPENRSSLYLKGQSLFLRENEDVKFDALIFQIDTDIIGEEGFEKFCRDRGLTASKPVEPDRRADLIRGILVSISSRSSIGEAIGASEVPIAIVEACETWVVAAGISDCNAEAMTAEETRNNFGKVFARLSGQKERKSYKNINKNVKSRKRICSKLCEKATPRGRAAHYDLCLEHIQQAIRGT